MQQVLVQIKEILLSQKCVAIISHNNPDGDTLGSQLALAGALDKAGIETILINNDEVSDKYHFVAGSEKISALQGGYDAAGGDCICGLRQAWNWLAAMKPQSFCREKLSLT